jgi:sialic acid synthase SpsE
MSEFRIGPRCLGEGHPTYFIADIAANHDGQLERAIRLVQLAAEAGADAAKFQHFRAGHIVSRKGFEALSGQLSHQASWKKSVFEVYQNASVPWEWTPALKAACEAAGLEFMSAAYDFGAVDMLDPWVRAYKIGSGDITWLEMLEHVAGKGKPVLLATGASDLGDVQRAVACLRRAATRDLCLMQCNTNYTASLENFSHVHLNVLRAYRALYPEAVLGLSDHTPGSAAVLGAVALGARVIEKHFTDDAARVGPDHRFSVTPQTWRDMVDRTRELERALGGGEKRIEVNEAQTVIVQRRCLRAAADLPAGTVLAREHLDVLRPAPADALMPYELPRVLGLRLQRPVKAGDHLRWGWLLDER